MQKWKCAPYVLIVTGRNQQLAIEEAGKIIELFSKTNLNLLLETL